jgi:hypothetical protein
VISAGTMMIPPGEQRQQRVGRVLAEVLPFRLPVVAQLAVDPVPPDEVVDAEGDERQQGHRPQVALLDLELGAADLHLGGHQVLSVRAGT